MKAVTDMDPQGLREHKEEFLHVLTAWFMAEHRDLPWRNLNVPNPYHVWISEIMLQQTRVTAVIDYFRRFTDEIPDIATLAGVPDDRLMKLWEGLGYYSRARNLKRCAQVIMQDHKGTMPRDPAVFPGSLRLRQCGIPAFGGPVGYFQRQYEKGVYGASGRTVTLCAERRTHQPGHYGPGRHDLHSRRRGTL